MNELIIIRGLPGSGKSTLAKSLTGGTGSDYFEADKFFEQNGEYNFDPSKLKDAHKWCLNEVEYAMQYGHRNMLDKFPLSRIVVSNTFTQEWEFQSYIDLAKKYNYIIYSIIVENRHQGVNEHNVPEETIKKMKDRFEINL